MTDQAARNLTSMHLQNFNREGLSAESLLAQLKAQDAKIKQLEAELEHSRKSFDRASATARIGVWECALPTNELTWTDVVYDIFDFPRGTLLERSEIVKCYLPETVEELTFRRDKAIAERGGFSLDAEITTFKGNRRWIRITATVECENDIPVRIFGMKQDITEQKIVMDQIRYLAEFDHLTGLSNRRQFYAELSRRRASSLGEGDVATLLLIDLDGFKKINDKHGHIMGDACLMVVAKRLKDVFADAAVVARIGGDEFGIILQSPFDETVAARRAEEIITALSQPIDQNGFRFRLGASIGISPIDNSQTIDIFQSADAALYAAKAAGRNTFKIFSAPPVVDYSI